jgi:hypothetical protein
MMSRPFGLHVGAGLFVASVLCVRLYVVSSAAISARRLADTLSKELLTVESINEAVCRMERIVQRDEGGRGIAQFCLPLGELQNAAIDMVDERTRKVAIITGFPCMIDFEPPTETVNPTPDSPTSATLPSQLIPASSLPSSLPSSTL